MPVGSIDTREHVDKDNLMGGHICSGRDIRVFTDASYKADDTTGGIGVFLESDAKGIALRMDVSSCFPPFFYDYGHNKVDVPQSLGTNVLLLELVAIHEALQWVGRTHTTLASHDEVNLFSDSSFSLTLIKAFSYDKSLEMVMRCRSTSERAILQDVILPVLHSIAKDANALKCNVNFYKVKAHCGINGNEMADCLAKMGRCLPECSPRKVWDAPYLPSPTHTYAPSHHAAPSHHHVLPTPRYCPYGGKRSRPLVGQWQECLHLRASSALTLLPAT